MDRFDCIELFREMQGPNKLLLDLLVRITCVKCTSYEYRNSLVRI
jgi:hypothetical protein